MNDYAEVAKQGGGSMALLGVIAIILGILAICAPLITGVSIAMLVGLVVLAGGILRMVWAFRADSLGKGLLMFALGGLTLIAGLMMVARPLFAAGVLTILLAAYFVVDGVFEIAGAFQVKPASGWGMMLFGGIVSLILGIMIWRQFPLSGAWAIGVLLGIKLLFAGMMMLTVGSTVRSAAKAAAAD